jgi:hypothetical protein
MAVPSKLPPKSTEEDDPNQKTKTAGTSRKSIKSSSSGGDGIPLRNNNPPTKKKKKKKGGRVPLVQLFDETTKVRYRTILLMAWCGYFVQKTFRFSLLPHGIPQIMRQIPKFATVNDFTKNNNNNNNALQMQHGRTHKIVCDNTTTTTSTTMIQGPETIVFGKDDRMYIMTETAWLVEIIIPNNHHIKKDDGMDSSSNPIIPATCRMVHDLGNGRPLGGAFDRTGKYLYMADAILGLTRIAVDHSSSSSSSSKTTTTNPTVEVLVSSVPDRNGGLVPSSSIRYCDDVAVGPKSGRIYFTDATTVAPDRVFFGNDTKQQHGEWDTLYASKVDFMRGYGTGRLLMYDPTTQKTTVLMDHDRKIHFANGVAVDKDERYVVMAETFGLRIHRYDLRTHTSEILIDSHQLPGYVDGMDCSRTSTICYAVMPSAILPIHKWLNALPPSLSRYFRIFMSLLPRKWTPPVKKFGGIVEFDSAATPGSPIRTILDPTGRDISMLTGVTIHKDKLYLGSLTNPFVGVYDLNPPESIK